MTVLDVDFNSDGSCFAIGSEGGFYVYKLDSMEPVTIRSFSSHIKSKNACKFQAVDNGSSLVDLKTIEETQVTGVITGRGVGLIKMLLNTNYLLIVGGGKSPIAPTNKVIVWDEAKGKPNLIVEFPTPILNCGLSKKHLIVALKSQVLVYSFSLQPQLISRFDTTNNEEGILDVLLMETVVRVAFPARTTGQIQILELQADNTTPGSTVIVKAHLAKLQTIKMSKSGKLIASASITGTIIRVHDTKTSALLFEFRRGLDRAKITSMGFSPDDLSLAVLSDKNTLHIFRLKQTGGTNIGDNKTHPFNKVPLPLPAYFHSKWSFLSRDVGSETSDTGSVGWTDNLNIVIIWKLRALWEKWSIEADAMGYRLVRNGWKGLSQS